MVSIESVIIETADPTAAASFYTEAFGSGSQVRVRASEEASTGFRGFTMSLVVSQPATVSGPRDGTGSHRLVIGIGTGSFTDPDGFAWESCPAG